MAHVCEYERLNKERLTSQTFVVDWMSFTLPESLVILNKSLK